MTKMKQAKIEKDGPAGLRVSDAAAEYCSQQARGRSLVLEFRELSPSGCCTIGAMVKPEWRSLGTIAASKDMVNGGEIDGVPLFYHHVIGQFLRDHPMEIVLRGIGPLRWLAIKSDKDPAMWSFLGDDPFGHDQ